MINYAIVVPYVYQEYFDEFIKTCKFPRENMLIVDNTVENIGIMAAHNLGVKFMEEKNADWLIVMSAGIRFGENGGLDFLKIIEENQEALMIHGSGAWNNNGKKIKSIALGWHLTAFNKKIFETAGNWDENFTPYGLDDVDLTIRIQKAFGKNYDLRVFPCDFRHESTSHSITIAGVKSAYEPRNEYFKRKWGRDGGEWKKEGYLTPFNLNKPLSYWPEKEDKLSIFENEYKNKWSFNE